MWGTIAAAAVSAASNIFGGIQKSRTARSAANKIDAEIARRDADNKNYYNKNYYSDATQLADNRRMLTMASERLRRASSANAGMSAVTGATNAQSAAAKEAANQAYADAVSGVAANAQAYKQNVENNYRADDAAISNARIDRINTNSAAKQAAIDNAVSGVNAVAQSIASLDSSSDMKAKNEVKQNH